MCGICGIVSLDGSSIPTGQVEVMTATLHHRGPDHRATWSSPGVALGSTRLSIIDLSAAAHQPMTRGTVTLAYNGEIYNFTSIRERLEREGVVFRSRGDTEVVLEAIRAWGLAVALDRFDGMFALATWDSAARVLTLARDRFGIKPLYWARAGSTVAFASEARALLQWKPELAEVREEVLEEYLTFRDIAGEATLFRHIDRLLPGQMLIIQNGGARRTMWAQPLHLPHQELEETLAQSVRSQLLADVPVGTLCSGGIDSGIITALAARERSTPVHAFTVAFPGFALDESSHAAAVAQRSGCAHHVLVAEPRSFAEDLFTMTRHHDEPLKFENSVMLFQICKMARDLGVIVLLTGEGADELFGGYPHFVAMRRLARIRRWGAVPFSKRIRWGAVPLSLRARNIAYRLISDPDDLIVSTSALTSSVDVASLLGRAPQREFPYRREVVERSRGDDMAERVRAYDIATYLPPILIRQDKMSMAASVESRVPMLSNAVAAHALSIPARRLADRSGGKVPLRELALQLLPHQVVHRRKIGFNTPTSEWMRQEDPVRDLLSMLTAPSARTAAYFDRQSIARAVDEHTGGIADRAQLLWTLLSFEVWLRECCRIAVMSPDTAAAMR